MIAVGGPAGPTRGPGADFLTWTSFYTKLTRNALETLYRLRKHAMTFKRSTASGEKASDRRSGMNRRWIKTPYQGPERRSGRDRRGELPPPEAVKPEDSATERTESLENLVLSTTVRLEALARLLVAKGLLSPKEISDMLQTLQSEYRHPQIKRD